MTLFVTSSPFVDGAPRAILSNANGFVDRIRSVLPENPHVVFDEPQRAITAGQAVVLYDGNMVVGGGTITEIL